MSVAHLYGTGTIKRARRTQDQVARLDKQIVDVLTTDQPQSVRHIFYRMTDPRLAEPVEKSELGYRHVQYRLKELRRAGAIPYGWITDATRRGYFTPTYQDRFDFVRQVSRLYRADLWSDNPVYCEVWTESRSIAGVIEDDCRDLCVSLYPAGGFSSITLAYEAAAQINEEHNGRDLVILYIGDYDPAGVLIDVALERELREHLDSAVSLSFRRLGITAEQIARYDLPTKPRKVNDRRSLHIAETVEAEAMPAAILRRLLRKTIESFLSPKALAITRAAENSERAVLELWAAGGAP
jgi:hypothetical protein